jgi:hypothetical protein
MNKETVDQIQKKLKAVCTQISTTMGNPRGNKEIEKGRLKRNRA